MNAQVQTQVQDEAVKSDPLTRDNVLTRMDGIIAAIKHRSEEATKASGEGKKAVSLVRAFARDAVAAKVAIGPLATSLADRMKLAGLPKGTIDPYRAAFRGYAVAVEKGVDVEAFKSDAKGNKRPMTAPEAREAFKLANETDAEKAIRLADEALKGARKAIMQRVNAVKDLATLQAILDSDILPALPEGEESPQEEAADTRAAREAARLQAEADAMLSAAFGDADVTEVAEAQEA